MTSPQELLHAGLAIVTAALYLYAGARQLLTLDARQTRASQRVLWIASFAVSCHLLLSAMDWVQGNLDLGFLQDLLADFSVDGIGQPDQHAIAPPSYADNCHFSTLGARGTGQSFCARDGPTHGGDYRMDSLSMFPRRCWRLAY